MTLERRKLLYELYDEYKNDYGRAYAGKHFEADDSGKKRAPRLTFYESFEWFEHSHFGMNEEEFIDKLYVPENYGMRHWNRYTNYIQYRNINPKLKSIILHDKNLCFGLDQRRRTELRKAAVLELGYSESWEVPVERLHELNMLVIEYFKKELSERHISYT